LKTDPRGARQLILGGRGRILMNAKARAGREKAWPGLFNEQPSGEFRHTEEQLQCIVFPELLAARLCRTSILDR
jgi:hypothetical protein